MEKLSPTQEQLDLALFDYVHWYNHIRIHGSLGYSSPIEFKKKHLNKIVYFCVDNPPK